MTTTLIGIDFTSAPTRRKPITVARGTLAGAVLRLDRVQACTRFAEFEAVLAEPGPWLGAFDFPFGLPRAFVDSLALGHSCAEVSAAVHARCAVRMEFRALVDAWGQGLPHRVTDRALGAGIGSTSPLQTRYVPVGFMWFEGLSRLLAAGLTLPGLHGADPQRLAFEGYPGALAHALIGRRSYKNRDEADRLIARKDLVDALEQGRATANYPGAPRLKLSHAMRDALVADASGDRLDAVLCLVQAAWAQAQPGQGLPPTMDPVEGWILGAQPSGLHKGHTGAVCRSETTGRPRRAPVTAA
jgi:hypothetical protein